MTVRLEQTFTFQTRIALDAAGLDALDAYAEIYGRVERKVFAAVAAGEDLGKLKSEVMVQHGLTARQYNAIAAGLKGKIASIKERLDGLITEAKLRLKKAEAVVKKLSKAPKGEKP